MDFREGARHHHILVFIHQRHGIFIARRIDEFLIGTVQHQQRIPGQAFAQAADLRALDPGAGGIVGIGQENDLGVVAGLVAEAGDDPARLLAWLLAVRRAALTAVAEAAERADDSYGEIGQLGLETWQAYVATPWRGLIDPAAYWRDLCELVAFDDPMMAGLGDDAWLYFVHSLHGVPDDPSMITATVEYGSTVNAAFRNDNVFAALFHPEKSSRPGLALLANFVRSCQHDTEAR
jgi:hypothetical protein